MTDGSPDSATQPRRRPRAWMIVVGALVLVVGVVGVFGGYSQRTDQRIDLDPGVTVSLNHAEVRILSAAVRLPRYEGGGYDLMVFAEVRNIADLPLTNDSFTSAIGFGYVNDRGDLEVAPSVSMSIPLSGESTETSPRGQIIPGGDVMPVIFTASAQDVDVSQGLQVALVPVRLEVTALFEVSHEKEWVRVPSSHFWRLSLPLTEVA